LASDRQLEDGKKIEFLDLLDNKRETDIDSLIDVVRRFSRANQRISAPLNHKRDSHLFGHAMSVERFEEQLIKDPHTPFNDTTNTPAKSLRRFFSYTLERQKRLLQRVKLSPFQMWCFYDEDQPAAPFTKVLTTSDNLRRQLGLGHLDINKPMIWCSFDFKISSPPHTPTTFDAEFNEFFRTGGKSLPLDGASDGVFEAVHEGVTGEALSERLQPAG